MRSTWPLVQGWLGLVIVKPIKLLCRVRVSQESARLLDKFSASISSHLVAAPDRPGTGARLSGGALPPHSPLWKPNANVDEWTVESTIFHARGIDAAIYCAEEEISTIAETHSHIGIASRKVRKTT